MTQSCPRVQAANQEPPFPSHVFTKHSRLKLVQRSTLNFNRELLIGECGALALANVAVPVLSRFTPNPTVLSSAAVAATLIGGSLGWIGTRILDQVRARTFTARSMAGDIGYFTPAAIFFGFCVYDPVIYLLSHYLLLRGHGACTAVLAGQLLAFLLFLLSLNLYRFSLFRLRGKTL
jgi:hypothetical protein